MGLFKDLFSKTSNKPANEVIDNVNNSILNIFSSYNK